MDEILKKLLNSEIFNEETKGAISEAFSKALKESEKNITKKVRKEMAERYEKDKGAIHKAIEQFLEQELASHVEEFRGDISEVQKLKAQYAEKIAGVKEAAQKHIKARVAGMEKVLGETLRAELKELHDDQKVSRRAYLNAINEAQNSVEEMKSEFKKKAAKVLEDIINVQVSGTMDELKEDIIAARKADFGRELFEAFYNTFRSQFFNSSSEFRKLTESHKEMSEKLAVIEAESNKKVQAAEKRARIAEMGAKQIQESVERKQKVAKLLETLSGKSREKMKTLLEASETKDLEKTFKRYLPELITESKSQPASIEKTTKAVLELRTGSNTSKKIVNEDQGDDDEIVEIARRAGVNK